VCVCVCVCVCVHLALNCRPLDAIRLLLPDNLALLVPEAQRGGRRRVAAGGSGGGVEFNARVRLKHVLDAFGRHMHRKCTLRQSVISVKPMLSQ
jgi:hypothetical protein